MATYYGDSIGDAARSEERQLERFLNLQLANREFAARERARADAIAAQNAANAMAAHERGQALSLAERNNRINTQLGLEERDYERRQNTIDTLLGLDEAEKNRKLQRDLNTLRNDNYLQRLQQTEDQRTYSDLAKRIAADEIRDIPSLQDAEGGRLGSDEWVDLKTRLGQHQQRLMGEAAMGPELAAREATLALRSDPNYAAAGEDAVLKRAAIDQVMRRLGESRVFSGKLLPDYTANDFKPNLGYKYSGPRDAIDWYRPGGPARNPAPPPAAGAVTAAAPADRPGLLSRMAMSLIGMPIQDYTDPLRDSIGQSFQSSRSVDPTPEPVAAEADATAIVDPIRLDPLTRQKLNEIRALRESGMSKEEAALVVARKYQNQRAVAPVRTF